MRACMESGRRSDSAGAAPRSSRSILPISRRILSICSALLELPGGADKSYGSAGTGWPATTGDSSTCSVSGSATSLTARTGTAGAATERGASAGALRSGGLSRGVEATGRCGSKARKRTGSAAGLGMAKRCDQYVNRSAPCAATSNAATTTCGQAKRGPAKRGPTKRGPTRCGPTRRGATERSGCCPAIKSRLPQQAQPPCALPVQEAEYPATAKAFSTYSAARTSAPWPAAWHPRREPRS